MWAFPWRSTSTRGSSSRAAFAKSPFRLDRKNHLQKRNRELRCCIAVTRGSNFRGAVILSPLTPCENETYRMARPGNLGTQAATTARIGPLALFRKSTSYAERGNRTSEIGSGFTFFGRLHMPRGISSRNSPSLNPCAFRSTSADAMRLCPSTTNPTPSQ